MRLTFLLFFSTVFILHGNAQLTDDFSSGNISIWAGDTSSFIVNSENQLQLMAEPTTGNKLIYTPSTAINNAVCEVDVHLHFNTSSSNYTDIILVADRSVLESSNGYFIRIGNTKDEISLYQKDGNSSIKIIDGQDDRTDVNSVSVRVKATRDGNGNWELFSDMGNTGTYTKEGEVFNNTYLSSSFFAIKCVYTSTRAQRFSFDNIFVVGEGNSDTVAPIVNNVFVNKSNELSVSFSEEVNYSPSSFLENCSYQQPVNVHAEYDSILSLVFKNDFPENEECNLIITRINDKANNQLTDTSITFKYIPPVQPGLNQLIINEIMADPSPAVELPEYEYLEIFNPTNHEFMVIGSSLHIRGEKIKIPDFQINPGSYITLVPNAAKELFSGFGQVIGVLNWKALLNQGDTISLINRYDRMVFQLIYSSDWYGDTKKSEGGFSLEMIDVSNPCGGNKNWAASESNLGGTPGLQNSVVKNNPDILIPSIINAFPTNNTSIEILFSERIHSDNLIMSNISIAPGIAISQFSFNPFLTSSLTINTLDPLQSGTNYTLTYQGLQDCAGNYSGRREITFVLPESADSLDMVFNEIMYDPVGSGAEFIEIKNNSSKHIDLFNWKFAKLEGNEMKEMISISDQHKIIFPDEILAFTKDKEVLLGQFPRSGMEYIIEINLFSLPNEGATIQLLDFNHNIIDQVTYSDDLHHPLIDNSKGVSLERISYVSGSALDEVWQTASTFTGGGSPGLPNSHYINLDFSTTFTIEPRVFAPNNDGYRDFTSIQFSIDDPGSLASLYVFDLSGRLVKTLINNENIPGQGSIIWEGDSENGTKAPIGNYIVLLELTKNDGRRITFKESVAIATNFK